MSINPKNPTFKSGQNLPSKWGITYIRNHRELRWFDEILKQWRPAVRLSEIRAELLIAASTVGSYQYPRGAGEGTNVTAPLAGDLYEGGDWDHRPIRLFQLRPEADQYEQQPATVMMYNGKVVLDPFDHPIRDFGNDLPVVISSEIKGWEIEGYLRKNRAITCYDLIARCPASYTIGNKTYNRPPFVHCIDDRANRFRQRAGLLSWRDTATNRGVSSYIYSLLPPGATHTYALGGDLSKEQFKARKAANKPFIKRKSKVGSGGKVWSGGVQKK